MSGEGPRCRDIAATDCFWASSSTIRPSIPFVRCGLASLTSGSSAKVVPQAGQTLRLAASSISAGLPQTGGRDGILLR